MTSPWRPEFEAALRMFAEISEDMVAAGAPRPILVGGAAVELYTGSQMMTGDFDVVTPHDDLWVEALRRRGFVQPGDFGSLRGWVHPELRIGFEVVGNTLMNSMTDSSRIQILLIDEASPSAAAGHHAPAVAGHDVPPDADHHDDGGIAYAVIPVEDLIADRLGQYHSGSAREMLTQAQALYRLYSDLDLTYLEQRIRQETLNDHGLDILSAPAAHADD